MINKIIIDMDLKTIKKVRTEEIIYDSLMTPLLYDKNGFHEYHSRFVDDVYKVFVLAQDKIIGFFYVGKIMNSFKIPYSSPFSMLYLRKIYKLSDALTIIKGLKLLSIEMSIDNIQVSLPPDIYNIDLINIFSSSFVSEGFSTDKIDINHHYNLSNYKNIENYILEAKTNLRNKYKITLKNNLEFSVINNSNFEIAYDVIKKNRDQKGYPLKISKSQMRDLIELETLESTCFDIFKSDDCIAAAIVFDINKDISQIIYWGDNIEFRDSSPMSIMFVKLFDYYNNLGKKIIDIGPSSENGVINLGLASFKESFGCSTRIKTTFRLDLDSF